MTHTNTEAVSDNILQGSVQDVEDVATALLDMGSVADPQMRTRAAFMLVNLLALTRRSSAGVKGLSLEGFADELTFAMAQRGATVRGLEELLGIDKSAISRMRTGKPVEARHFIATWNWVHALEPLPSHAGEDDYTPEHALRRARDIAVQSEAAPWCMGEIIKVADMALGETTPMPAWIAEQVASPPQGETSDLIKRLREAQFQEGCGSEFVRRCLADAETALASQTQEASVLRKVREAFNVEYSSDGKVQSVGYDSNALRPLIAMIDAALASRQPTSGDMK